MKSWEGNENKGYSWKYKPDSALKVLGPQIFLLFFTFAASFKVLSCFVKKKLQDQQSVKIVAAFFWALAIVSFFWNIVDMSINLYLLFCLATSNDTRYYGFCKLAVLALVLVFGLVWMMTGCLMAPSFAPPPKCVCPFCCCTCCCTKRGKLRYLYCCAFFQIALFVFLVTANIIPILLLTFVQPVVVLSEVALLATIVFSLVIWIALPFSGNPFSFKLSISGLNASQRKRYKNGLCYLILLGLFIVFILSLVVLYLEILIKGTESNDYIKIFFSFFPSVVIGGVGFLMKRKFLDRRKGRRYDHGDLPNVEGYMELTDTSLADLEKGLGNSETTRDAEATEDRAGRQGGRVGNGYQLTGTEQ